MYGDLLKNQICHNFDSSSPILTFKIPNSTNFGSRNLFLVSKVRLSCTFLNQSLGKSIIMHFCLTFSLLGLIFQKRSQIGECNALQFSISSTEACFEPQSLTYLCRSVSFVVCNAVLCVCMTRMQLCRPLIQKPTMLSYF